MHNRILERGLCKHESICTLTHSQRSLCEDTLISVKDFENGKDCKVFGRHRRYWYVGRENAKSMNNQNIDLVDRSLISKTSRRWKREIKVNQSPAHQSVMMAPSSGRSRRAVVDATERSHKNK
jgi:hypothetical protein